MTIQLILFVTIFLTMVTTLWVYGGKRDAIRQSFLLTGMSISLWALGLVLMQMTRDFVFATPTLISGILVFAGLFLFAKTFPEYTGAMPRRFYLYLIPALVIIVLIPFDVFIQDVIFHPDGSIEPINTAAMPFHVLTIVGYISGSLFFMVKKLKSSSGIMKLQMQYLFLGLGLSFTFGFIADVLLPFLGIFKFNVLGGLSPLFFVGFTAYAIVHHQLMDIRVVIQRGLIYTALLAVIIGFYIATLNIVGFIFQRTTDVTILFSAGIVTILGIFGVPFIEKYFRRLTDKIFFKDRYNYGEAIHELSETLNKNIHLEQMLYELSRVLKKIFRINKVTFLLIPQNILFNETGLHVVDSFYSKKLVAERTNYREPLVHSHIPHILSQDTISPKRREVLQEIRAIGRERGIEVSMPIILEDKMIGVIGLSKKLSGNAYTAEDLKLIQTFGSQAAVALEKARLYAEVRSYSKKLEERVEERTSEIKQLQEEQKQVMIDLSHGLQTPLTIMKGELEILKNHSPKKKKLSAFERSIDEVSQFIYDLLFLAKLERSQKEYKEERVNLSQTLNNIEYFDVLVREKNISITNSIEPNIHITGNKKDFERLVVNLVSNAVKYMSYTIKDRSIVSSIPSPFYEGAYFPNKVRFIRDDISKKKTVRKEHFDHACELLGEQVKELKNRERQLTQKEKEQFIVSLSTLLELHILIQKDNK